MTVKRVHTITKVEDQRRDDRSIVDFEVTRWGFGQTVSAWKLGCERPPPKPDYKGPFESSIRPWGADIDLPRNETRYYPDTEIRELDSDEEDQD